ncbi:MAG: AAA family ATPase [Bacteroidales bacterium]|nr:AAA family ATPase [Bacteroidales bacterium]
MEIKYTVSVTKALKYAAELACELRNEYITPEHFLRGLFEQDFFIDSVESMSPNFEPAFKYLVNSISALEVMPGKKMIEPELSAQFQQMLGNAAFIVGSSGANSITVPHMVKAIFSLKHSDAQKVLMKICNKREADLIRSLIHTYSKDEISENVSVGISNVPRIEARQLPATQPIDEPFDFEEEQQNVQDSFVTRIEPSDDDFVVHKIELEKLMSTLCRCECNNALLLGEPGVGKTEMLRKLAKLIEQGKTPKRLKDCSLWEFDLCGLISSTQYRGELENRLKSILDSMKNEGNNIICIDNIHSIAPSGQTNDNTVDITSILKPYLDTPSLFFVGITTFDDFQRTLSRNKSFVRRFQRIDIKEPDESLTYLIATTHRDKYSKFHNVKYSDEVLRYAISLSKEYMNDRAMPEKALYVLDQAGAECELQKKRVVTTEIVDKVMKNICNLETIGKADENANLATLYDRMTKQIYGQDKAIKRIVEAIQMSKAGLLDEGKPIASFLFVGPTGVGKTEVARTLAKEMGVELQRFDMSEYAEKHTISKLIGSPAGYIGYDDGGLLTSALQKTPHCVLLLDEIEKAHADIYNILLQVMDYGQLTDNKGKKTSFQHAIIIMTSNAGAQYAHLATLGFGNTHTKGDSMFGEVKKIFKPEFLNRLSGTIVFNDMDLHMASLILDKKFRELTDKLSKRNVKVSLSNEAREWLLKKCYTKEYGARETDRILATEVKPLFIKEILFGKLASGGNAEVDLANDSLIIKVLERVSKSRKTKSDGNV